LKIKLQTKTNFPIAELKHSIILASNPILKAENIRFGARTLQQLQKKEIRIANL